MLQASYLLYYTLVQNQAINHPLSDTTYSCIKPKLVHAWNVELRYCAQACCSFHTTLQNKFIRGIWHIGAACPLALLCQWMSGTPQCDCSQTLKPSLRAARCSASHDTQSEVQHGQGNSFHKFDVVGQIHDTVQQCIRDLVLIG